MNTATHRAAAAVGLFTAALLASSAPRPLAAQQPASLAGVVVDDVRGDAVPGARVTLSAWRGELRTDSAGRFRIDAPPLGTRRVRIEAPGYAVLEVEIVIPSPAADAAVYRLIPAPVALEGLAAQAEASTRILDFERRRQRGLGGRFLTRRDLAARETSTLGDVLRGTMPGAQLVRSGWGLHLTSKSTLAAGSLDGLKVCYAQIYVDGARLASMKTDPPDPPDLGAFSVRDLEAVEYYSSASNTPVELRTPSAGCGTLVLWTRNR